MVTTKRAYEPPAQDDGVRVLVDRLWPRGVSKGHARIERWMKELAPSTALRKWFGHDPARWDEFRRRYRQELKERQDELAELRELVRRQRVTLVYGAKDTEHNDAVALKEILGGGGSRAKPTSTKKRAKHARDGARTKRRAD
ncbi:MAG TPA: DUF488 domain-containing protein [Tepidisphaeraceae bacterium]|jgi:uncharacterized protein YeaO (DUF488 family)